MPRQTTRGRTPPTIPLSALRAGAVAAAFLLLLLAVVAACAAAGGEHARAANTATSLSTVEVPPVAAPLGAATQAESGAAPPSVELVLVAPEAWSERSRANLAAALSLLPASVQGMLGNPALGPLHVLVNEHGLTLSGQQPYGRAANFFSTNDGRNEVVLYPEQSVLTILHELGHAYNLRRTPPGAYAQVLLDPEMQSFLAAAGWRVLTPEWQLRQLFDHSRVSLLYEGPSIWPRLSRDDPLEDFANSFALYFYAPQDLERLSPARYAWFRQHFAWLQQVP